MSQIDKLLKKLNRRPIPNDMTHEEVAKIAKAYGCSVRTGGNHQMQIVYPPTGTVIPIPCHDKEVPDMYIQQLKRLISEIETRKGV